MSTLVSHILGLLFSYFLLPETFKWTIYLAVNSRRMVSSDKRSPSPPPSPPPPPAPPPLPLSLRSSLLSAIKMKEWPKVYVFPNKLFVSCLFFLHLLHGTCGGIWERKLLRDLFVGYNVLERPVANESEPILVSFGLTLQQIIDVDEKNQILVTNIWLKLEWVDANLRWNVSDYGGVQDLRIPPNKIWKPDVLMYNSADERFDSTFPSNIVVRHNGSCLYVPPGIFKSTCKIDITWFPFDDQRCTMKFGSWTYDGWTLDLRLSDEQGGDLSSYVPSGEWVLLGIPGIRNEKQYACCSQPYVDITFTIHIRRRTLYYGFNLIIPCCIISSMTLLGFTLPPDSGEKLTLGVTILLSMTVFLLQLTETLPATSDAVSVIGSYFACIMIMVAFSVVMTVVVLNFHHRTSETCEMPPSVKKILLVWLPWLLHMEKPGAIKPPRSSPATPKKSGYDLHQSLRRKSAAGPASYPGHHSQCKEMEMRDRDRDRDRDRGREGFGQSHSRSYSSDVSRHLLSNSVDTPESLELKLNDSDLNYQQSADCHYANCPHHRPPLPPMAFASRANPGASDPSNNILTDSPKHHSSCLCFAQNTCTCDMTEILTEVRFLSNKIRRRDEVQEIVNEWRFAAMVIDRLCLIIFSTFTAISTGICVISAPHLIV